MSNKIKILHLTDLHFKKGESTTPAGNRRIILEKLIKTLAKNKALFTGLDAVVVSGDIGYDGMEDYNQADIFFKTLCKEVIGENFPMEKFIFCPGNHDADRGSLQGNIADGKTSYQELQTLVKTKLNFENISQWDAKVFQGYNSFCKDFNLPTYDSCDGNKFYTFGYRIDKIKKICYLILNSSWLCLGTGKNNEFKNRTDYGNLFLGANIIKLLIDKIESEINVDEYLKISVVHHPPSWYNWTEKFNNDTNNNKPSLNYINEFSDLVFCGHEHGEIKAPILHGKEALWICGGSTFSHGKDYKSYRNNFSIIEINKIDNIIKRTPIVYDPGNEKWTIEADPYEFFTASLIRDLYKIYKTKPEHYRKFLYDLEIVSKKNVPIELESFSFEEPIQKKIITKLFKIEDSSYSNLKFKNNNLFKLNNREVYIYFISTEVANEIDIFKSLTTDFINQKIKTDKNTILTILLSGVLSNNSSNHPGVFSTEEIFYDFKNELEQKIENFNPSAVMAGNIRFIYELYSLGEISTLF